MQMKLITSKIFILTMLDGLVLCFRYATSVEANIKCLELSTMINAQDVEGIKEMLIKEEPNFTAITNYALDILDYF